MSDKIHFDELINEDKEAPLINNGIDEELESLDCFEYCDFYRTKISFFWSTLFKKPFQLMCVMLVFTPIFVLLLFALIAITRTGTNPVIETPRLYNSSKANSILDSLCNAWRKGIYAGDFCETLCMSEPRNWTMIDYIDSGSKRVMRIREQGKDMILKMQHPYLEDYDQQLDFRHVDEETFADMVLDIVNEHLRLEWPARYKSHLLRKLWPPYIVGKPLSEAEKRSIWALIQQDEFINQGILQISRVTPKLLGVCGHAYRSEYLIPFRMKSYYLNLKAKILVHLMGTLKLFYEFLNDPLQWCDVKFENLGLSADYPKRFVMMDSDMMFTESKLNSLLTSRKCQNDSQCGFFDCHSECNTTTGYCTPRTNDNIDVFCNKLVNQLFGSFWSKSNKYLAACHQDPVNATQRLNELRLVWSWTLDI